MRLGRSIIVLAAVAFAAVPAGSANATTCAGIVSHCANSSGLLGHTHGCSTSGTLRTCLIHWHGNSDCSGATGGTCSGTLNAGADGFDTGTCTYGTLGSCSVGHSTPGRSVTFPVGSGLKTSCATLTTNATGLGGGAGETDGPVCFTYS